MTLVKDSMWTRRWIEAAQFFSSWSKDRSRKIGCVIVDDRQALLSQGWNGFPRGVDDTIEERHVRPEKYLWIEHAERNAIDNAAANGVRLRGATVYSTLFPCQDCARGIIQSGIARVVALKSVSDATYDFSKSHAMLLEAGVVVVEVEYDDLIAPTQKEAFA